MASTNNAHISHTATLTHRLLHHGPHARHCLSAFPGSRHEPHPVHELTPPERAAVENGDLRAAVDFDHSVVHAARLECREEMLGGLDGPRGAEKGRVVGAGGVRGREIVDSRRS